MPHAYKYKWRSEEAVISFGDGVEVMNPAIGARN